MAESANGSPAFLSSVMEIERATLYKRVPLLQRLDVLPFAVLWAVFLGCFQMYGGESDNELWWLGGGLLAVLQGLFSLSAKWSTQMECLIQCNHVTSCKNANLVCVTPRPNCGRSAVVKLRKPIKKGEYKIPFHFFYQRQKYSIDSTDSKGVCKDLKLLSFPVDNKISEYSTSKGLKSESATDAFKVYGVNTFDIPLPTRFDLFLEQLQAPMFVFQAFCMLLYCLDDYWMLSVSTFF
eukprot:m.141660 g.141660  ORF g.141660 m.141660 type:complete len:237 (+) comp14857_c0_seq2:21-731(+)